MKTILASKAVRFLAVTSIWLGTSTSAVGALVMDLGTLISGSGTPGETPPWLRATFTQSGDDVLLKMEALNLVISPSVEAVDDWAFNINPAYVASQLTAVEDSRTGEFGPGGVAFSSPPNLGYAGFSFDFSFAYPNPVQGDAIAHRFTDGDSITFRLSRAGGLLVSDFNYLTPVHDGQQYYSGAHIIGIGANDESAFVGALTVVPEPTTVIAGGLLLLPLGLSTIRTLRKKLTA